MGSRRGTGHSASLAAALRPAGSRLGKVTTAAAELFGLRAETPVAVGGADTQCALGAGAVGPVQMGRHGPFGLSIVLPVNMPLPTKIVLQAEAS